MPNSAKDELSLTSVRAAVLDLLRAFGMTTIFGNPGSTELPLFREFPKDFRYVLGLQEAVVVGMADGYAQATRNAAFVNLHSAAGVGHAMGNIFTAFRNRTPLVITAGQQARSILPYRSVPVLGAGHRAAEALREMELRARARRGRAARDRARLLHRDAAAARAGARLHSRRRLGEALRARRAARREHRDPARAARAGSDRRRARRIVCVRRSSSACRRRSRRGVGRRRAARRAPQCRGVGRADVGALQLPGRPRPLRRIPAADAREDRGSARRVRRRSSRSAPRRSPITSKARDRIFRPMRGSCS